MSSVGFVETVGVGVGCVGLTSGAGSVGSGDDSLGLGLVEVLGDSDGDSAGSALTGPLLSAATATGTTSAAAVNQVAAGSIEPM
jgi:hypothetical protein